MKTIYQASVQSASEKICKPASVVWILWLLVLAIAPVSAHAELFGLPSGRLADLSQQSALSVEAGFITGKVAAQDYSQPSVRINYSLAENTLLFGDVGQSDIGDSKNTTFGAGVIYQMRNLFGFTRAVALKGSVHQFKFDSNSLSSSCSGSTPVVNPFDGSLSIDPGICSSSLRSAENKGNAMALEVLVSGNPIAALNQLGFTSPTWYANAGFHTFNGVDIDSTIGLGGGLVLPFANAEAYVGLDIIDKTTFGFGVRYAIR